MTGKDVLTVMIAGMAATALCMIQLTLQQDVKAQSDKLFPPEIVTEATYIQELEFIAGVSETEPETEEWCGTERQLTDEEWEHMAHMIMAEARGEDYDAQYAIACVVLNRVDSPLFPSAVMDVLYQDNQFYGAWDTEWYDVSDSVWEAIQAALIDNKIPPDVMYFTSEGWLPHTEPWEQIGAMWFSRQIEQN